MRNRVENSLEESIGFNLRNLRLAAKIPMETLGAGIGVTYQQIQKYERGKNRISLSTAVRIAEFLKCSIDELVENVSREDLIPFNAQSRHHVIKTAHLIEGLEPRLRTSVTKLIEAVSNTSDLIPPGFLPVHGPIAD
ncbi:helix-turn-helix transcriptional regulator [Aureimonas sp. AU12]|uniref:helix-turn-helix domain-containing protein n=1 Tax=Aureimonas sp. AU12 TaxID=1638161 RepID=UPI0009E99BAA|nr:helix-turn-helix transcriptional regulator [Aureimonas sp. AU12]